MDNVPHIKPFSQRIINQAIAKIINNLRLPQIASDDWAIDTADASRIEEFCAYYVAAPLTQSEKYVLMELIVASLDDYEAEAAFSVNGSSDSLVSFTVEQLLRDNFALHKHTIKAWCQFECGLEAEHDPLEEEWDDEDAEDDDSTEVRWLFQVAPMMRRLWAEQRSRDAFKRFSPSKTP